MGFIIIGIGSLSDTGLNGVILQIISHGFIGAALFFLVGTSYDRIRHFDKFYNFKNKKGKLFSERYNFYLLRR